MNRKCLDRLLGREFAWSNFNECKLNGTLIEYACFTGANLTQADFSNSVLRYSELQNANLNHANFTGALLQGCDLRGSSIVGTLFDNAIFDCRTKLPFSFDEALRKKMIPLRPIRSLKIVRR